MSFSDCKSSQFVSTEPELAHTSGVYKKRELQIVRGRGAHVWDHKGNRFVDCVAGIAVASVGHCHPTVVAAVRDQSERLITCHESWQNDRRAELYQSLARITPDGVDRFFLCNSGSEAVEAALKFARLVTGRSDVIAMSGSFHGRTMGALSATHRRRFREPFAPLVPGFSHVRFNQLDKIASAVSDSTAAVIVEPIQGEGGVHVATQSFLQGLQDICSARGSLLILDEIQSGFGRTGDWFACERSGVTPDMLCMGKAMAGGLPMAAVGLGPKVRGMTPGSHGSTFGGNPLCCAAALGTIAAIESEQLIHRAEELGQRFCDTLQSWQHPLIREVRGRGLFIGVDLATQAQDVAGALSGFSVLAMTAGRSVLRLVPPLVISEADLDCVAAAIRQVLDDMLAEERRPAGAR